MTTQIKEREEMAMNGFLAWLIGAMCFVLAVTSFIATFFYGKNMILIGVLSVVVFFILVKGICIIDPNTKVVTQFFGKYSGTVVNTGLVFINPLKSTHYVSVKQFNFSNKPIKVNDKSGNPLMVSAMVKWRVADAAKATFVVEDYNSFIANQLEGVLAEVASKYAYDSSKEDEVVFRKNSQEIAEHLRKIMQDRAVECGLEIMDVRFNHCAYAVEIAAVMLRKQQAQAMLDARSTTVEGVYEIIKDVVKKFEDESFMKMTDEQKVKFVTSAFLVLCAGEEPKSVVQLDT